MRVSKDGIVSAYLSLATFFGFIGYYVLLAIVSNTMGIEGSRRLTIPLRVAIVGALALVVMHRGRRGVPKAVAYFWMFAALYLIRVFVEGVAPDGSFHRSPLEFFLFFTSFVLLPLSFLGLSRFNHRQYEAVFMSMILSSIAFSLVVLVFYGEHIGGVGRLSLAIGKDENYLSPLALSYAAALTMGIGIAYMAKNRMSRRKRLLIYVAIALSLAPFLLGASRGALFALALPFLVQLVVSRKFNKAATIATLLGLAVVLYGASIWLGSAVFERFLGISEAIQSESSSAIRLEIWRHTWTQFLSAPIFGNSLESDTARFHPHNVILEVLVTTGIVGFTAFALFLFEMARATVRVTSKTPQYFWVVVIFLQALVQNMFSGAIYGAAWMALGAGLVVGLNTLPSPAPPKRFTPPQQPEPSA